MRILLPGEKLTFDNIGNRGEESPSDHIINEKYNKGDVRIVTEQARYPLHTIPALLASGNYKLNPEFQRRHRWERDKQSRLIESFIMNVPIPPIFLYEDKFSFYEVMDGLQRLTAIQEFYQNKFSLVDLQEWRELNGKTFEQLPSLIKDGINRRYLSSIILLQETAKSKDEALRLKQLVFERINSGGVRLEAQESRNAIYNGSLNQLCIKMARNPFLCRTWAIPEPSEEELAGGEPQEDVLENDYYRKMQDVELVLRFFAYRQRNELHRGAQRDYFDNFLKYGNRWDKGLLKSLGNLFEETIKLAWETFGESAFWLWRKRSNKWDWLNRPTVVVYDPLMFVLSQNIDKHEEILARRDLFRQQITKFYEENYDDFEGRYTNKSNLSDRNKLFANFIESILKA